MIIVGVWVCEQELELEPWELDCWFPIRDQKGEITGRLHFRSPNPTRKHTPQLRLIG